MRDISLIHYFAKNGKVRTFLVLVPICKTLVLMVKATIVTILLGIWVGFLLRLFLDAKLQYGFKILIFFSVVFVVG